MFYGSRKVCEISIVIIIFGVVVKIRKGNFIYLVILGKIVIIVIVIFVFCCGKKVWWRIVVKYIIIVIFDLYFVSGVGLCICLNYISWISELIFYCLGCRFWCLNFGLV